MRCINILVKLRTINTVLVSMKINRGSFALLPSVLEGPPNEKQSFPVLVRDRLPETGRLLLLGGRGAGRATGIRAAEGMLPDMGGGSLLVPGTGDQLGVHEGCRIQK